MFPVHLTSLKTRDGYRLDGIVIEPPGRKKDLALIWIHGLSSSFHSGQTLIKELAGQCRARGIGFFKFNTRGSHLAIRGRNGNLTGGGFEKFTDCVHDIQAIIACARRLGYRRVVLAGHSTGANKTLYYMYKTLDRSVKGLILACPISDIPAMTATLGPAQYKKGLASARQLAQKNPAALMPREYGLFSAHRFLSLCAPGSAEDVFPYHNTRARWKELRSVRVPVAVIIGSKDEYLDRSIAEFLSAFSSHSISARSFTSIVIKGANHGFQKKEKEAAAAMTNWIAPL